MAGNLTEDVYMMQPEGFVDLTNAGKICKLQKSIYGFKQASQSWNIHFDEVVKGFGFIKNEEESLCLQEGKWELCCISNPICR